LQEYLTITKQFELPIEFDPMNFPNVESHRLHLESLMRFTSINEKKISEKDKSSFEEIEKLKSP